MIDEHVRMWQWIRLLCFCFCFNQVILSVQVQQLSDLGKHVPHLLICNFIHLIHWYLLFNFIFVGVRPLFIDSQSHRIEATSIGASFPLCFFGCEHKNSNQYPSERKCYPWTWRSLLDFLSGMSNFLKQWYCSRFDCKCFKWVGL